MRCLYLISLFALLPAGVRAGGLVTNTGQSAMFTRFQCRDATIDIDAAYYNPAGLVHMSSGFYLSLNNQTVGKVELIRSDNSNLSDGSGDYKGTILTPVFPGIYTVYRIGRFAFSGGINPIAGEGTRKYTNGLPSYERVIADAIPAMRNSLGGIDASLSIVDEDPLYRNITGYSFDMEMAEKNLSMGYQAGIAYMINSYLSVAAGIRIVDSRSYIRADVTGVTIDVATNSGSYTFAPDSYLGMVAEIATQIDETINVSELSLIADGMRGIKQMQVDLSRRDIGFTPVLGLNYAPSLMTNWALKYEFRTKIDLVTTINDGKDGNGDYRDGEIVSADIPAMLSIGVTRRPNRKIMIYSGIHYYFDKPVDFDGVSGISMEVIDDNTYEFAVGAEYRLSPELRASAGWLITRPGVNSSYQRENRFALASNTLGGGVGLRISPLVDLNLGISYTLFKKDEKELSYKPEYSEDMVTIREYYDTRKLVISAGLDFLFGENR